MTSLQFQSILVHSAEKDLDLDPSPLFCPSTYRKLEAVPWQQFTMVTIKEQLSVVIIGL